MTVKESPEHLFEVYFFDGLTEEVAKKLLKDTFLAGFHSRDKEVADLEQQLELATEVHHYTPGED